MAIAVVQGTAFTGLSSGTAIINYPATTIGNLLVFIHTHAFSSTTISSVNDNGGNTYTLAIAGTQTTNNYVTVQYYSIQTASSTSGTIVISSSRTTTLQAIEISGIGIKTPIVDATSFGTASSGTQMTVTSFNTTQATDIIVGGGIIISNPPAIGTAGVGYTLQALGSLTSHGVQAIETKILSGTSTETVPLGQPNTGWLQTAVAYRGGIGPNLIQSAGTSGIGLSAISSSWLSNTTTGNSIMVGVTITNALTLGTVTSITDTQGNAYQKAISKAGTAVKVLDTELWYASNIVGGAGSVTVNFGLNAASIYVREYSGGYNFLDTTISALGSSTAINTGTTSAIAQANELLIGVTGDETGGTQTYQAAGAYGDMIGTTTTATGVCMYDNIVNTGGAQTGTNTMTVADEWVSVLATFRRLANPTFSPQGMTSTIKPNAI